jgi:acyl dehydratase
VSLVRLAPRDTGPLGVADYVRYQGASGDLNPIHHDPDAARAAGFEGIFCPGMLSAGLLGSYLGDALGPGNVVAIAFSFREIVWPEESLTCRAEVVAERDDGHRGVVDLEISCTLADGRVAVEGNATFARDEQAP